MTEEIKQEEKPKELEVKTEEVKTEDAPNPYIEKYASRLKSELGDKYSSKFDKMPLESRIDAMEAALDVIKKIPTPIKKGEGTALGEHAEVDTKPKSFLEKQRESGYRQNLRDRGSYASIAANLYKK